MLEHDRISDRLVANNPACVLFASRLRHALQDVILRRLTEEQAEKTLHQLCKVTSVEHIDRGVSPKRFSQTGCAQPSHEITWRLLE